MPRHAGYPVYKNGAGITYFNRPRDLRKTFGFGKVRVDTRKGIVFAQNNLQYSIHCFIHFLFLENKYTQYGSQYLPPNP